jgi:hypothetical protein
MVKGYIDGFSNNIIFIATRIYRILNYQYDIDGINNDKMFFIKHELVQFSI